MTSSTQRTTKNVRRSVVFSRLAVAVAATLSVLFIGASPASAHAELVTSNPAANSMLPVAPKTITLEWSELVTTATEQIDLVDQNGEHHTVTLEQSVKDGHTLASITTEDRICTGSWILVWKVVSDDGHLISGSVPFAVDDAECPADALATPATAGTDMDQQMLQDADHMASVHLTSTGPLDRGVEVLSWSMFMLTLAAGFARRRRIQAVAGVAVAAFGALRIAQFSYELAGDPFMAGEAKAALAVAISGLVLAAGSLVSSATRRAPYAVMLGIALGAFGAQGLFSGHHLDLSGTIAAIALASHIIHLVAASVWVAAVGALGLRNGAEQARSTRKLATLAVASLAVSSIVLAGSLLLPYHAGDSVWTVNLAVKVTLVGVAALLGALNHRRLTPLTSNTNSTEGSGHAELLARVRRFVIAEIFVLFLVMGATGALTTHRPPALQGSTSIAGHTTSDTSTADASTSGTSTADASTADKAMTHADQQSIALTFDDGRTGKLSMSTTTAGARGHWMLVMDQTDGAFLENAPATVEASLPAAGITGVITELSGTKGSYMGEGTFSTSGTWKLTVTFLADEFTQVIAYTTIDSN